MRIIEVIKKVNGRSIRIVYVDGSVFINVRQPEQGFFGWKDGDFSIDETAGKAVELARIVNRARDLGEEVIIRSIVVNEDCATADSKDFTENELELVANDIGCEFDTLMNWLIVAGIAFDWFEPQDVITQDVIDQISETQESISGDYSVNENEPISVPMTADVNTEIESNNSYDSGSSYDSGGSSDCGGGGSCD